MRRVRFRSMRLRATPPRRTTFPPTSYNKSIFWLQLQEMGLVDPITETILKTVQDSFTVDELSQEIQYLRRYAHHRNSEFDRTRQPHA